MSLTRSCMAFKITRTSDIGIPWNTPLPPGDEEPTNLELVRTEDAAKTNGGSNSQSKQRKKKRALAPKKKAKATKALNEMDESTPEQTASGRTGESSGDELDMTGWSADYNLPK